MGVWHGHGAERPLCLERTGTCERSDAKSGDTHRSRNARTLGAVPVATGSLSLVPHRGLG